MQRFRRFALLIAVPMLVATGPVVATVGASPAGAAAPGPIQIPLQAASPPGVTCPNGTYVAKSPGPGGSPVFVLQDPGPIQCPAGIDVLVSPGSISAPAPTGQAVALPLTAKSCAAGTALLNEELGMLGSGTPGMATVRHSARRSTGPPCPSGDAALAALHAALANVPGDPGGTGFITPGSFGLPAVQRAFFTVDPGPAVTSPVLTGFSSFTDTFTDITVPGTGPNHQVIDFRFSHSGIAKVKLAQFSPLVTTQPVSQSAPQGSSITFTAAALGSPAPTVQWQFSTNGGASWNNDLGETATTTTAGPLYSFENGWEVRAVFTNSLGTATSDPATTTVTP
jgi:large repetitive protein